MYATTEDGVISKGATFADIPAAASEKGGEGNILKGKIDTLVGTVAGVSSVTNPNNFSGGDGRGIGSVFPKAFARFLH